MYPEQRSVEWRNVTGAIDSGSVEDERELNVDRTDLGGCVDGVSMSFVLAISSGANSMPARLAAETAIASEAAGVGEESISRPPTDPAAGLIWNERLGSGMANIAAKKDRVKDVMVDKSIE
ncbi:MAG: hypothetical protein Q9220_005759 [cf. Caloplaca sp. 1 TL-2023]